jgi:dipeptidyl aminopeptidase/acylaminoacyl peptidase
MSKVDEELSRRLQAAERPVDVEELFVGLERRRAHRRRVRRIEIGALAVVVLLVTAAAFAALTNVFGNQATEIGNPLPLPANGEIVFSKEGADGRFHLFSANPDGSSERQITDDATNDTDPAVSPDGRTVAFVHELDRDIRVIATVPIEGGTITWLTDEQLDAHDPAWSPDGDRLAFVGASQFHGFPVEDSAVFVTRPGQSPDALLHNTAIEFADPSWSSIGGDLLTVAARDLVEGGDVADHWMIAEISLDDPPQPRLGLTDVDERAPAWSPDGTRLAFIRSGPQGDEVWTRSQANGSETLLASAVEESLEPDLAWAPDGSELLVSDGEWVYRVDPTPGGDVRDNLVGLFRGSSPSWQPIPAGTVQASPAPQLSPGADAGPDGYGFGIDICPQHVTWVTEQLDGIGGEDWAFVVIERGADGACPPTSPVGHLGVDVDQDQVVDMSYGPIRCEIDCIVFAAPDLDGDGRHEILVTESPGSIFRIGVYAIGAVEDPSRDASGIVRVEVGEPDLSNAGFVTGEPATLSIGGDEGWSYRLRCVDRPDGRFLIASSAFHAVDSDAPVRITEATLAYGELRMIVVDAQDRAEPFSPDPLGPQPEELCGTPIGVP